MLGFFRRHQKSFMLIFLVPGLLAMGITGAILSVAQNRGDLVAGTVFGEPIYRQEFDRHRRLYKITNPRAEDEEAWRFLAFVKAAERAGIEVSDAEIREGIHSDMQWSMARYRAMKRLEQEGISGDDPRLQRLWQQYFFEELGKGGQDKGALDVAEYKKYLREQYGIDHRSYEEQQRRELLVQRFLQVLRDLATVDAAEVREAYVEKHHLRVAEYVSVPAARYVPDLKAKPGDPGYVSDEQVKAYYERRELDFDEPRRVDLDYVAIDFAGAEDGLEHPGEKVLRAYNARRGIAPVASYSEFEDKILEAWYADRARVRAMDVMERLEDAARAAHAAKPDEPVDLAALAARVRKETGLDALVAGRTGWVTAAELAAGERALLHGRAVEDWFEHCEPGKLSAVLGNRDGLVLLQARGVKHARTPKFEDIRDRVREAYARGTEQELRAFYEERKSQKYRTETTYHLELAVYEDADFGGDHAKAVAAAKDTLDAVRELVRGRKGAFKDGEKFDFYLLGTDPEIKKAMRVVDDEALKELDKEALAKHPRLGPAADIVPTARPYALHEVEFDGGVGIWRLVRKNPPKTLPFEEVRERVAEDLRLQRGLERAEEAIDELIAALKGKEGEELDAFLAARGLERKRTEPFSRDAHSLEGIAEASQFVAQCFAAEVGGDFERWVPDAENARLLLLRVVERRDPPEEGFAKAYPELRKELLAKVRGEFAQEEIRRVVLEAKGISPEHLRYARELRDGPGGEFRLKIRQIFLPPDRELIGGWLDAAAKKLVDQALAELRAGKPWAEVVLRYSEHAASRRREGELPPSSKENLAESFGAAFAEEAYALGEGDEPHVIKSTLGYHIVKAAGERRGRRIFRHILISTDAKRRKLPEEIRKQAEESSRKRLEAALAALESGRSFASVAEEYGDSEDPLAVGEPFEMDYVTAFERAALAQPLEWELASDDPRANDPAWVPEVVEVQQAGNVTYHLFACARLPADRVAPWDPPARRDRRVFHIASKSKALVEEARAEMKDFVASAEEDGGRPGWEATLKKFQELASDYSETPDASKGGAVGEVRLEDGVRAYGDAFYQAVCVQADGRPVAPGYRTGVFRSEEGYHLVEVVEVKRADAGDRERTQQVTELLLNGTGWQ